MSTNNTGLYSNKTSISNTMSKRKSSNASKQRRLHALNKKSSKLKTAKKVKLKTMVGFKMKLKWKTRSKFNLKRTRISLLIRVCSSFEKCRSQKPSIWFKRKSRRVRTEIMLFQVALMMTLPIVMSRVTNNSITSMPFFKNKEANLIQIKIKTRNWLLITGLTWQ